MARSGEAYAEKDKLKTVKKHDTCATSMKQGEYLHLR